MKHLKSYKYLFESRDYVKDILLELEDIGLKIKIDRTDDLLEISIMMPFGSQDRVIPGVPNPPGGKYPGELFFWYEVKDAIIRLNDWYYEYSGNEFTPGINGKTSSDLGKIGIRYNSNSPFRMFSTGVEFGIGYHKPEDFDGIGDYMSFNNLIIEIKL